MKRSYKKGFTLVELLIVMAIVAVLIAISSYGIAIVQRNSRNSQRAQVANQFKVAVEKFYTNFGVYPDPVTDICVNTTETSIVVRRGTFEEKVGYRNSVLTPSGDTSPNHTAYCYSKTLNGLYSIQYKTEVIGNTSVWSKNIGTSDAECITPNITQNC